MPIARNQHSISLSWGKFSQILFKDASNTLGSGCRTPEHVCHYSWALIKDTRRKFGSSSGGAMDQTTASQQLLPLGKLQWTLYQASPHCCLANSCKVLFLWLPSSQQVRSQEEWWLVLYYSHPSECSSYPLSQGYVELAIDNAPIHTRLQHPWNQIAPILPILCLFHWQA